MKTEAEIRTERNEFEKQLEKYEDSEDLQAIVDALNWVLEDANGLSVYKD